MMSVGFWCFCLFLIPVDARPNEGLTMMTANRTKEAQVTESRQKREGLTILTANRTKEAQVTESRQKRDGGLIAGATIVGAIIGQIGAGSRGSSGSGARGGCSWQGTSNFFGACGPATCPDHHGYEVTEKFSGTYLYKYGKRNGRYFGYGCAAGEKGLCCRSKKDDNKWDGEWEDVKYNQKWKCVVYYEENDGCKRRLDCNESTGGYIRNEPIVNYPKCDQVNFKCKGEQVTVKARFGKITFPGNTKCFNNEKWYKV